MFTSSFLFMVFCILQIKYIIIIIAIIDCAIYQYIYYNRYIRLNFEFVEFVISEWYLIFQYLAGYSGRTCAVNIKACASVPCFNEATCTDTVNGYTCHCQIGMSAVYFILWIKDIHKLYRKVLVLVSIEPRYDYVWHCSMTCSLCH